MTQELTNIYFDRGITAVVVILFFTFIIYYFASVSKRVKTIEANDTTASEAIKTIQENTTQISIYTEKLTTMIENLSEILSDHDDDSKDGIKQSQEKLDKHEDIALRHHEKVVDKLEVINEKVGKTQSKVEQVIIQVAKQ